MTVGQTDAISARTSAQKTDVAAWLLLMVLLALSFVSFLDRQIISLMVNLIKVDLGISDSQIGILQGAAFGLVYPLFAVPLGYAADRYSRRWVIFLGVVFWSIAAVASGLCNSFDTLLAARIGVGIGEAALGPASASLISDTFPRHRLALVFSIFSCGALLGSAGALAIGGAVIAWAGDGLTFPLVGFLKPWQVAFVVTGFPGALVALLIFLFPEPQRPARSAAAHAPWSEVFAFIGRNWKFLASNILGFACLLLVTWAMLAWMPAILERSYGWTIAQIGTSLGLFTAVLGLSGQLTNGAVVDRMVARGIEDAHMRYYMVGAIIIGVFGAAAPFAPTAIIYLGLLAPVKFLLNFAGVSISSLQLVTPSRLRGRITALMGIVSSVLGGTFGPSVVAFFTDRVFKDPEMVPYSLGLTIALFMPLAAVLFALGLPPMRHAIAEQRIASANDV